MANKDYRVKKNVKKPKKKDLKAVVTPASTEVLPSALVPVVKKPRKTTEAED